MTTLSEDVVTRFLIGDPDSLDISGSANNKEISIWYTNPYHKLLLNCNSGRLRETEGKTPPVIINHVAYELRRKMGDSGRVTLFMLDLKQKARN